MKKVSAADFWKTVHEKAINILLDNLETNYPDAIAVVHYISQALEDMGQGGQFLMVGPSNTVKTLEEAETFKPHWKLKAETYADAAELVAVKPARYVRTLPPCPTFKGDVPKPTDEGIKLAKQMAAFFKSKSVYGRQHRPVMVAFGKAVGFGVFVEYVKIHENDRFVQEGVVPEGTEYSSYEFIIAGTHGYNQKLVLRHKHGLSYGAGHNGDLAEWHVGEYYAGPPSERYTWGRTYIIGEWVPMNFEPYKDNLIDDDQRGRRKRLEMKVVYLD